MDFSLRRDHFSQALRLLQQTSDSKVAVPILGAVKIDAEEDSVRLSSTNMDHFTTLRVKARVTTPGSCAVHLRRLTPIIAEMPELDLKCALTGNNVMRLSSGGSLFRLNTLPVPDFPKIPELGSGGSVVIEEQVLLRQMRQVVYARSKDSARYQICGACFDIVGSKFTLVATDGRRMAMSTAPLDSNGVHVKLNVVDDMISIMSGFLQKDGKRPVRLSWDNARFSVAFLDNDESTGLVGEVLCVGRLYESPFPDYRRIVPADMGVPFLAERQLLLDTLHRASLATNDKHNAVKLTIADTALSIHAESPDFGQAHETMQVEGTGNVTISFNPTFLLDILRALAQDKITLFLRDAGSPVVVKAGDDFLGIVMPVRL